MGALVRGFIGAGHNSSGGSGKTERFGLAPRFVDYLESEYNLGESGIIHSQDGIKRETPWSR